MLPLQIHDIATTECLKILSEIETQEIVNMHICSVNKIWIEIKFVFTCPCYQCTDVIPNKTKIFGVVCY